MILCRRLLIFMMLVGGLAPLTAQDRTGNFDPVAAWDEFEKTVRANYAYLDHYPSGGWEEQLVRSREAGKDAATKAALRRIMHRTALTFGDPHFIVGPFEPSDYNILFTSSDLVIGDDFTVMDVRAGSSADLAGIRPGWRLRTVEGTTIDEAALDPFGKLLAEPTDDQRAYGATLVANGRRGDAKRNLTFVLPDESRRKISLTNPRNFAILLADAPIMSVQNIGPNNSIAHIRITNSLGNAELVSAFDRAMVNASDVRAVILDLRNTPSGGNTDIARSIIGHFIDEWQPYQMHTIPVVERRTGVPRRFIEYAAPRNPGVDVPVVVLHGHWTGSMGEGLVIGLADAASAHTIGSDMGDLLGALWNFDLTLSDARVDLGGEALFQIDGTPREDYAAQYPLPAADRAPDGSDPAMQAALAFIKELPPSS